MTHPCPGCHSTLTAPLGGRGRDEWRCFSCRREYVPRVAPAQRIAWLEGEVDRLTSTHGAGTPTNAANRRVRTFSPQAGADASH